MYQSLGLARVGANKWQYFLGQASLDWGLPKICSTSFTAVLRSSEQSRRTRTRTHWAFFSSNWSGAWNGYNWVSGQTGTGQAKCALPCTFQIFFSSWIFQSQMATYLFDTYSIKFVTKSPITEIIGEAAARTLIVINLDRHFAGLISLCIVLIPTKMIFSNLAREIFTDNNLFFQVWELDCRRTTCPIRTRRGLQRYTVEHHRRSGLLHKSLTSPTFYVGKGSLLPLPLQG